MNSIQINNITGFTYPYTIYACDVYGNQCVLIATIFSNVPPTNSIPLPYQFNTAPAIGLKIIAGNGCERFEILYCEQQECCLLLQDNTCFLLQDNTLFLLQGC
jgi:hypothetical protein